MTASLTDDAEHALEWDAALCSSDTGALVYAHGDAELDFTAR